MRYQAPGIIHEGNSVSREQARLEVLAKAFHEAAGGFFEREVEYNNKIQEDREKQDWFKKVGVSGTSVGLVVLLVGPLLLENVAVAGLGLVIAIGALIYSYYHYTELAERIESNQNMLASNRPDGEVTFVSQIGVPLYTVPYDDRFIIFDGLNSAPEVKLDLANIDSDALLSQQEELEKTKGEYDSMFSEETVVSPEAVEEFSPNASTHRQLERPLVNQINNMTRTARDIQTDRIRANINANNQVSKSVSDLFAKGLLRTDSDVLTVKTRQSMAESESVVDSIRGVEEQAVSGDMLDKAKQCRQLISEIATDLATRLQENQRRVRNHYRPEQSVRSVVTKRVCEECLRSREEDIVDEIGLVEQILSSDAGSLGTALSDDDLDKETDQNFKESIRSDIEAKIPEISDELRQSYNRLEDFDDERGHCKVHGDVDTVRVPESGQLFGEVWRSLYYDFRGPIMDSVESLEEEAEQIRQNKEQKKVDLTQYEQIKDEAEQRYYEIKSDHDAARKIEEKLG